jgi:hypothetical protein
MPKWAEFKLKERTTQVFHDWMIFDVVSMPKRASKFKHTFGGEIVHKGLSRRSCGFPVHLLYRFNQDDPDLGIRIPNCQWLPLYYCFSFKNASMQMGYRVLSDDRVQPFFKPRSRMTLRGSEFADESFPKFFREVSVGLRPVSFDPKKPADAKRYVNVFGISKLTPKQQQAFRKRCKAEYDRFAPAPWDGPIEELIDLETAPCGQGRPRSPCPNPKCKNHSQPGSLQIFAIVPATPVPRVSLWGKYGGTTQIIYEMCPTCSSIAVTNQCD